MESGFSVKYEPDYSTPQSPAKTTYECDVLVVGAGFSGLMAAVSAKKTGSSVVLIDKGLPGFSGLSPYATCIRWFDAEMGDDRETLEEIYLRSSQYIGNQNWVKVWIDESKSVAMQLKELGLFEQYPGADESGYRESTDFVGYSEFVRKKIRHTKYMKILKDHGIETVPHTMVCDVIEQNGRVVGAVGFHVRSGAPIICHAKTTVLCMGGGVYKSAGWPTGGISFDAISIGYRHGLTIIGQEFEDFHASRADAPSSAFLPHAFGYLESMMFHGGEVTKEDTPHCIAARSHGIRQVLTVSAGAESWDESVEEAKPQYLIGERQAGDMRFTGRSASLPSMIQGNSYGAAPGFCLHTTSGIFCGTENTDGFTGLPGLYCAGDGCNGGPVGGAAYAGRSGFTSSFSALQGMRAGKAAAIDAQTAEFVVAEKNVVSALVEDMLSPMCLTKGYDANWALDCLQGIMAPMWTLILKTEERLNAALTQVEYIRDHIVPNLVARDSHSLRYCIEMKNKVLEAEIKLRASLARKESRGGHYREDYPYRNDDIGLCYYGVSKGDNSTMQVRRIEIPDEWKGNRQEAYAQRYGHAFFPGEIESAKMNGII